MTQITEDYCNYEIAKLLKEKGFDNEEVSENGGFYCDYECDGKDIGIVYESQMLNKDLARNEYLRATHQMALKWLREVYNIVIVIEPYDSWEDMRFEFTIYKRQDNDTFEWDIIDALNSLYKGYETCIEEAIKYTLKNLI